MYLSIQNRNGKTSRIRRKDWLQHKHGNFGYEWPYLEVEPRLLIEPFIGIDKEVPLDYKFFCFNGQVDMIQVDSGRGHMHRRILLDPTWTPFDFAYEKPMAQAVPDRPHELDDMVAIAETLSRGLPFVRVDLYNTQGTILFGEMTFFPEAGMGHFRPPSADRIVGNFWDYSPEKVRGAFVNGVH